MFELAACCHSEAEIPPKRSQTPGRQTPGRRPGIAEITGMRLGNAMVASRNVVPDNADSNDSVQPSARPGTAAGALTIPTQIVDNIFQQQFAEVRRPAQNLRPPLPAKPRVPGRELPVSPRPAVMTPGIHIVSGWKIVYEFDIRERNPRVQSPLEEVMAQQSLSPEPDLTARSRNTSRWSMPFPHRSLRRTVLVHTVGDGSRVGIDPAGTRKDTLKQQNSRRHWGAGCTRV